MHGTGEEKCSLSVSAINTSGGLRVNLSSNAAACEKNGSLHNTEVSHMFHSDMGTAVTHPSLENGNMV